MYFLVIFALFSVAAGVPTQHKVGIYGGSDATQGQFPFAVGIRTIVQVCDGVILNNRWILTGAQCAPYITELTEVVAGNISLSSGTVFNVSQVIPHEGYDEFSFRDDIALLQIEGEFVFDDNIKPIDIGEVGDNQTCTILGWGSTIDAEFPDALQFVETTTISVEECKNLASQIWTGLYFGPETVCTVADKNETGICYGDGGGPLVCDGKLAAIIGYTVYGCGSKYPDMYARVSAYADWIETHMKDATTTTGSTATTTPGTTETATGSTTTPGTTETTTGTTDSYTSTSTIETTETVLSTSTVEPTTETLAV